MKPPVRLARPVAAPRAATAALVGALALAGCSAGAVAPRGTTAAAESTTGTSSSMSTGSLPATSTSSATTSPAGPSPAAAVKLTGKSISVTDFGHTVTVLAIQRNWPWPAGYEASSATLELVAVQMTWAAGTKYTAAISRDQFLLVTGTVLNRPDATINAVLKARKYALLPATVPHGKKATGWLVFKVDPKGATSLALRYDRPKAFVTTTNQTIPARSFTVKLVG